MFPNARYFVVGYGTNDLGMWPEVERTSPRIIENLDGMVQAIREDGRQTDPAERPACERVDVPPVGRRGPAPHAGLPQRRLGEYCRRDRVPLVEIASKLRDEHFADELHPNEAGAQVIAGEVYRVLGGVLRGGEIRVAVPPRSWPGSRAGRRPSATRRWPRRRT